MTTTPRMHFDNLDALRFVAFVFIFLGHALDTPSATVAAHPIYVFVKTHIYTLGKTGFSFAFVLSSYINTWVILEERQRANGQFSAWRYYVRRALRIWPLYFLVLFIGFVLIPWIFQLINSPYHETAEPLWFILFVGNFYLIEHGFTHSPILSVLWSVSVEEQFYLFWPFLLVLFRWRIKWLIAVMIVVFLITTYTYQGTSVNLFFHTLYLLGDISVGAAFAHLCFYKGRYFDLLMALGKARTMVVYLLFGLSLVFYQPLFNGHIVPEPFSSMIEKLWFAVLLGFIITEQNFNPHSLFKFGQSTVLTWLGTISYGLFCFHEIGLLIGQKLISQLGFTDSLNATLVAKPIIAFLIIVRLAHLSWHWFERPFLLLKRYFYS